MLSFNTADLFFFFSKISYLYPKRSSVTHISKPHSMLRRNLQNMINVPDSGLHE